MSDTVSFAELDGQHVELLPARTVLSLFSANDGGVGSPGTDAVGGIALGLMGQTIPITGNSNAVGGAGTGASG